MNRNYSWYYRSKNSIYPATHPVKYFGEQSFAVNGSGRPGVFRAVILFLSILLNSSFSSFGQNPLEKQWDYRFGGTYHEELSSFHQVNDGGYILGGTSYSGMNGDKTQPAWGDADYWIVKTDSLGIKLWDKRFGGTSLDWLSSVDQTTDGGYILGGYSCSGIGGDKTQPLWGGSSWDFWIVKIDSVGNILWDKRFGGTDNDDLSSIQQTTDGGYILGGYSTSGISGDKTQNRWGIPGDYDYWIVKIDSVGNVIWDKRFGGTSWDFLLSLQQTTDAGYILGGYTESGMNGDITQPSWGLIDYWIVKVDSLGNMMWDKRFGGTDYDRLMSLQQTSDGGYILGGRSESGMSGNKSQPSWGLSDFWIVKTDPLGNLQWDKTLFAPEYDVYGYGIQSSDGCYVIANSIYGDIGGYKTQQGWGGNDYWIVKFCDTTALLPIYSSNNKLCEKFCTNFFDPTTNNPSAWYWIFDGGTPATSSLQNPTGICYNNPGVYNVTLITTNAFGNDTLILNDYITVSATPPFPTITQTGYTLTSTVATSYQWKLNSVNISGATNQSYTIMQSGLYTVNIGDSNSCVNSASKYVLITGIANQITNEKFLIEPNPSNGSFRCIINHFAPGNWNIEIFNSLGQKIFSEEGFSNSSFQKEIHLVFPPEGIYLITITTEEKIYQKKIVVNR